jgi:uncharacterized Zn finger protein
MVMPQLETPPRPQALSALHHDCPECGGRLTLMRVLEGREVDYWTKRCIRCGGLHLDIVDRAALRTAD